MTHDADNPQHTVRRHASFLGRYGMTEAQFRDIRQKDPQKANELRVVAYQRFINKRV